MWIIDVNILIEFIPILHLSPRLTKTFLPLVERAYVGYTAQFPLRHTVQADDICYFPPLFDRARANPDVDGHYMLEDLQSPLIKSLGNPNHQNDGSKYRSACTCMQQRYFLLSRNDHSPVGRQQIATSGKLYIVDKWPDGHWAVSNHVRKCTSEEEALAICALGYVLFPELIVPLLQTWLSLSRSGRIAIIFKATYFLVKH